MCLLISDCLYLHLFQSVLIFLPYLFMHNISRTDFSNPFLVIETFFHALSTRIIKSFYPLVPWFIILNHLQIHTDLFISPIQHKHNVQLDGNHITAGVGGYPLIIYHGLKLNHSVKCKEVILPATKLLMKE